MKRIRRDTESFNLSFLDCICCGFGAVLLLFVISMGAESRVIEGLRMEIEARYRALNAELASTERAGRETSEAIASLRKRIAEIQADIQRVESEITRAETATAEQAAAIAELEDRRDALQLALDTPPREIMPDPEREDLQKVPIGIPMDRNYLVFVIDTSGSMRELSRPIFDIGGIRTRPGLWREAMRKLDATLQAYPEVRGIQFLDADGRYIIDGSRGRWLEDSPALRRRYYNQVNNYPIYSRSNPVPGIEEAIRRFRDPEKRIAIFVVGDEFGGNEDAVLRRLDRINPRMPNGERAVSINALGFPTPAFPHTTARKYANLMREVTHAHDGAFIGYLR